MTPESELARVILKSGRDKAVRLRHPRLFAGAIKDVQGKPKDGMPVDVVDNRGEWLARGIINQQAQIAVRLMTWDEAEPIDDALWARRIRAAIARRDADPTLKATDARRLIFGESDGLPGLIADDYANHLVLQMSTLAAGNAREAILDALEAALHPVCIVERDDEERMRHERPGSKVPASAFAAARGTGPDAPVEVHEGSLRFQVDLRSGQKTGFYLDQRDNRARVARYCAGGQVLNAFAFTGAFAVHALAAGAAHVTNLDSSAEALKLAGRNASDNGMADHATQIQADAFDQLRAWRADGTRFDVVILDPPKFAHNLGQVDKAARAYKDLNRVGFSLVKPGGILVTFSCSGVIDAGLFQKILFSASIEAGRDAQIVERLTQASDHPVLLTFPESEYLKGLICRVA